MGILKSIAFDDNNLKSKLLQLVNGVCHLYSSNVVEDISVMGCRLLTYHCELNPIELIWSQVKCHVAAKNVEFKCL